jgi:isopenicillin N synthase-like dioxygenase
MVRCPENSEFPEIDYLPSITPTEIENWRELSDAWGEAMRSALMAAMELLALGFGEPTDLFTSRLHAGVIKLAPTGLDLSKHGPGTVGAGFHNDSSFVTGHGISNYSGLWAYPRSWERFPVRLQDDGCLLVQAGRALENYTAGRVIRGFHYVQTPEDIYARALEELARGLVPWRVSTTMFAHTRTSEWLEPIGRFVNEPEAPRFFKERVKCGTRLKRTVINKIVEPNAA